MIDLWKGSANSWDCDEMGHMNVRVYVEKALEGLGTFAAAIQLPNAYRSGANSTLQPSEQHIRFIREVMPGRPLSMQGCVLEWDDMSVLVYQEIRHSDGQPAAAFRTRLFHIDARTGEPFPWNQAARNSLDALVDLPPGDTQPRGLDMSGLPVANERANMTTITDVGAPEIGRGTVPGQHLDIHGRMLASWFIGRISDSVPNLLFDWRKEVANASPGAKMGAAVLEYRLVFRKWPRAGDRFIIHSSLEEIGDKTHSLVHWVMNPDDGEAWATTQAVAVTFDLNTRKVITTPPGPMQALAKIAPRGLRL